MMAVGKSLIPRVWEQMVSRKLADLERRLRSLEVNSPAPVVSPTPPPTGDSTIQYEQGTFRGDGTNSIRFTIGTSGLPNTPPTVFVASPVAIWNGTAYVSWKGDVHADGVTDTLTELSVIATIDTGVFTNGVYYYYDYFMARNLSLS